MALLRLDGSMQTRSFPFGFLTTITLETQSVGSITFLIYPYFSISINFYFKSFIKVKGTFLGALTTGVTESSIFITYSSPRLPLPRNKSLYSSKTSTNYCYLFSTVQISFSSIFINPNCSLSKQPIIFYTFSFTMRNCTLYTFPFRVHLNNIFPITSIPVPLYATNLEPLSCFLI